MTPEQLRERKRYIGASEAPAVCGVSPWRTPLEVYHDKITDEVEQADSDAMYWGRRLESAVLEAYAEKTGRKPWNRQKHVVSKKFPWMAATLDATTGDRVVEVKTAGHRAEWGEPGTDAVPLHYLVQVTHQMIVTNKFVADIPVLISGNDFRIYTVEFDRELADMVIERETAFWECVKNRTPPEPVTVADTTLRWPQHVDTAVEATDEVAAAITRLRAVEAERKVLETETELLQTLVRSHMAEAAALQYGGAVLATWKTQTANRLDSTGLKAAHPELVREFTKPTTSRVFRLSRDKA